LQVITISLLFHLYAFCLVRRKNGACYSNHIYTIDLDNEGAVFSQM